MNDEDPIELWKRKRAAEKKSHKQLLGRLRRKKGNALDEKAQELHDEAFRKIDCLDCGNCCSTIPPILTRNDISRMSKFLGMKPGKFEKEFVRFDNDGDAVINASPCPFLGKDNYCSVYEARPKACQQYPHADGAQFSARMNLHLDNAQYCPAVFHILEVFKTITDESQRRI